MSKRHFSSDLQVGRLVERFAGIVNYTSSFGRRLCFVSNQVYYLASQYWAMSTSGRFNWIMMEANNPETNITR